MRAFLYIYILECDSTDFIYNDMLELINNNFNRSIRRLFSLVIEVAV